MSPRQEPTAKPYRVATVLGNDPLTNLYEAYAHNVFVSTSLRQLEEPHLSVLQGIDLVGAWAAAHRCARCKVEDPPRGEHLRVHLRRRLKEHGKPVPVPGAAEPFGTNLRLAGHLLGLTESEDEILKLVVTVKHGQQLGAVLNCLGYLSMASLIELVSVATQLTQASISTALQPQARLISSGLLVLCPARDPFQAKLMVDTKLLELIALPDLDRHRFLRAFLDVATPPTLGCDAFAESSAVELASGLLRAGLRGKARGVNLLLSGPSGVGKSELARLLSQEVGVPLFAVGRVDNRGDSPNPRERLASLRLAHLLVPPGQGILLFDELEDLFRWESHPLGPGGATAQMSKQWFGATLEENPLPTIWCTNRTEGIDKAFLRRFTFAIELKAPGARQRADVLVRHAAGGLPRRACEMIAQRFEASPAQFGAAVHGARLLAPAGPLDQLTVEALMAPVHKLITGRDALLKPVFDPSGYQLAALNCTEDLTLLADRLAEFKQGPKPGVSLCLYGPPGVGKSEFVKYLAWKTGRPFVYRRGSDLLSPFVGMTERQIAAAFDEARADGALLLFDEADSFLRERRAATHSWELTQVNEFLQQLESFPGLVACTTNLWQELDEASLRRFVFKLQFHLPTHEQVVRLFGVFFPVALASAGDAAVATLLRPVCDLAPGDFAAVDRRVRALGTNPSAAELVTMLAGEVAVKRTAVRAVGFGL